MCLPRDCRAAQAREDALRQLGLEDPGREADDATPYLLNICDDPLLTGALLSALGLLLQERSIQDAAFYALLVEIATSEGSSNNIDGASHLRRSSPQVLQAYLPIGGISCPQGRL